MEARTIRLKSLAATILGKKGMLLQKVVFSAKYEGSNFSYTSGGWFARAGIDFNVIRQEKFPGNDQILIGFRYGFSSMHYQAKISKSRRVTGRHF
jgi:hypothetical protein